MKTNNGATDGAYIQKKEDADWYYAIGGYASWGKGKVTITDAGGGKKSYKLVFTYKLDDMYNWDTNKGVALGGFLPVPDEALGQMHRAGVAKEYRNVGSHSETFEWVK